MNQMYTAIRLDYIAHLSDLECKGSILEWFLHRPPLEESQISTSRMRTAIGMLLSELGKLGGITPNLSLVTSENSDRLINSPGDIGLFPARGAATFLVLDEQMARANRSFGGRRVRLGGTKQLSTWQLANVFLGDIVWTLPE